MKKLTKSFLKRLCRDTRGIAATEFALLLPIMVTMFLGIYEGGRLLTIDRRGATAANMIADLVSQTDARISTAELGSIMAMMPELLGDDGITNIEIDIFSVVRDPNNTNRLIVHWSQDETGAVVQGSGTEFTRINTVNRVHEDSSVIYVELSYDFGGVATAYVFDTPYSFNRSAVRWPRLDFWIQRCTDTNNIDTCSTTPS